MPEQFKNGRNSDGETSLQILIAKQYTNTLRIDQFRSKSVEKCSVFIILECSQDALSKMCRLEFRFQILTFSKYAGKKCAVSCERETYPSNFSLFKMCRCSMRIGPLCKSVLSETLMRFHLKRYALPCETLFVSV